jgi:GT2 family glycosyltransferase
VTPKKVLIGSPVHQKPAILREFLTSLEALQVSGYTAAYMFMDDNGEEESSSLLTDFQERHPQTLIVKSPSVAAYQRDDYTHHWREELIWKVAMMKDQMLRHALDHGYEHIFLADSDLVLHPHTLNNLIRTEKEIISNIFWTRWQPETIEMPQVWLQDEYSMNVKNPNQPASNSEVALQMFEFFAKLRMPGVYEVGGLGACTLISRKALQAGVRYERIKNLSFWGEDRHFCIRAAALGFSLYVDTHYPAYHIYRDSDLEGVVAFKQRCE